MNRPGEAAAFSVGGFQIPLARPEYVRDVGSQTFDAAVPRLAGFQCVSFLWRRKEITFTL